MARRDSARLLNQRHCRELPENSIRLRLRSDERVGTAIVSPLGMFNPAIMRLAVKYLVAHYARHLQLDLMQLRREHRLRICIVRGPEPDKSELMPHGASDTS